MRKVLGEAKRGELFIVSAPAGTGKTTLVQMLCSEFPCVIESVSYTTRAPRSNEVNGRDYVFLSKEEFLQKIEEGEFLEYAEVFGEYYGTSRTFVEREQKLGKHVILVIDTQGALQLKEKIEATFIFISPPNLEELRIRMEGRKSETKESIQKRLSWAEKEMALVPHYDFHIVNEQLSVAYEVLRSILIAEEHRVKKVERKGEKSDDR